MPYKEKDFQTDFNKWVKANFLQTAAFELKLARGPLLPFKEVKEHQVNALYIAKHHSLVFKIPDSGFAQNPFDSFSLYQVPAYIVIMFNGRQEYFYFIDVDEWLKEWQNSKRKSLTEARAFQIGTKYSLKQKNPVTTATAPANRY